MRLATFLATLLFAASGFAGEPNPQEVSKRLADALGPACIAIGTVGAPSQHSFYCHPKAGPIPFTEKSLFEIGSISKGLTGFLLADMVMRGEVRLDDKASKYSRPGAKLPTRGGKEITLRDLVTHTAGLPLNPPTLKVRDRRDAYADFGVDDLYASLAVAELASDIGTKHSYSNFGFMWLSDIVARAGGKSFGDLLVERVLGPLGMSTASLEIPREREGLRVVGHSPRYIPTLPWHFQPPLAGMGGVHASIVDMERLAEALAGKRQTPLDAVIKLAVAPLFNIDPRDSIGYAWVSRWFADSTLVWHSGGTGGFSSMIVVDREKGLGSVVLANSAIQFQDLALHLVNPAYALEPRRISVPTDAASRRAFSGRYDVPGDDVLTVSEDGESLMVCCTKMQAWPVDLLSSGPGLYETSGFPIGILFRRGNDGSVLGMDIKVGAHGQLIFAKRL